MGKAVDRSPKVDPEWPQGEGHPVSEFATALTGALSPFGAVEFPLPEVPYQHPHTEINK